MGWLAWAEPEEEAVGAEEEEPAGPGRLVQGGEGWGLVSVRSGLLVPGQG